MKRSIKPNRYIWQQEDWPQFTWDSNAILEPLSRLSLLNGKLDGQMSMLGFHERSESMLSVMTEELTSSSEIEGVFLNPASVRSSIARRLGIDDDGTFIEDHYVEGLVDVMLDAVSNSSIPLSTERLFNWHGALFPTGRSGMLKITVADWRKGSEPMQVVSGAMGHETVHFEAPPSVDVPDLMEQLIDWCNNTTVSPYIKSAVAHLWFVSIHPFDDGNGRISRTLSDMFLSSIVPGNTRYYSVSGQINRSKKEYYANLEQTQKGSLDITKWLLWYFTCIEKAITRALDTIERTTEKALYWDKYRGVEINERQRKVVNRLWDGFDGKLTTSKWAKICSCSQDTALRDINDLVSKGMLKKADEGGRNANYLLPG